MRVTKESDITWGSVLKLDNSQGTETVTINPADYAKEHSLAITFAPWRTCRKCGHKNPVPNKQQPALCSNCGSPVNF